MGRSRADVVMVTEDALYGVEIKSDADTYTRLARQVKDYDKYYDRNLIVAGTKHAHSNQRTRAGMVGNNHGRRREWKAGFTSIVSPEVNPKLDIKRKISILWRPELEHIQELNGMPKYERDRASSLHPIR